jgi:SAM-dependent methyltransferase
MTPPTAEQIQQAWDDPKLANLLYHDWEADSYDDKWSISFDERCITYATDRFRNAAGEQGWPYGSALELGCGTGFILLNLKLGGVLDEGHVTDLSPGMVEVAKRNGSHLGFELEGRGRRRGETALPRRVVRSGGGPCGPAPHP